MLKQNNADIAFIQECHLKKNKKVQINGYNFIYDNSPLGVAVIIKSSMTYNKVNLIDVGINTSLIQIDLMLYNNILKYLVGSIYIPCNYPSQPTADWKDNSLDVFRICHTTPSFPNGPSFLDHFLIDSQLIDTNNSNFEISSLSTYSDHFPIKLKLKLEGVNILNNVPATFTSYTNTNWNNFRHDVDSATHQLMPHGHRNMENDEIDDLLSNLKSAVSQVHSIHSQRILIENGKCPLSEKAKKLFKLKHQWQKELKYKQVLSQANSTPRRIYTFDENFNATDNDDSFHFTNTENIKNIVQNLNNKISSGIDEISNYLIKQLPDSSLELLTFIHNQCINNGYFPKEWKLAKIIPYLIKIINSYLEDRKFVVQIREATSVLGSVNSGVPQGSVLVPFLFNIFLHDFPHITENSQAILYADNCLIYAHNKSPSLALQHASEHLQLINEFYKKWGIKINAGKSEAICIRNASGKCPRTVVPESKTLRTSLEGIEIPFHTSITYLGSLLTKKHQVGTL
ncbi:uncharacterized protein LOC142235529 [Haematobia irritans]|uniref:uncharacterized protein LOC142235529 n=1 Tax=Haematobia irritans TaxID=7368 RepID=UPI003F502BE7